jgi:hypothetical protein
MNTEVSRDALPPSVLWLDTGEQEDELEQAEREEKEAKKRGQDEPDEDLERQRRLNKR